MTEGVDWIARAGTRAKGKRPAYLDTPAEERMLSILMAVVGEVAVLRLRLDTVERLLGAKGTISRADIEAYAPDRAAGIERGVLTKAYIARVMRGVQQEMEAMASPEPSVEEVSRTLGEL